MVGGARVWLVCPLLLFVDVSILCVYGVLWSVVWSLRDALRVVLVFAIKNSLFCVVWRYVTVCGIEWSRISTQFTVVKSPCRPLLSLTHSLIHPLTQSISISININQWIFDINTLIFFLSHTHSTTLSLTHPLT